MKRLGFIPDVHRPYHDKRSWNLALKCLDTFKPDILICLGDYIDNYCVSRHRKNPAVVKDLKYEVDDANKGLDELGDLGIKRKYMVLGNHEARLEDYLADKAPELYGLVSIEELLKLDKRGWHVTAYGKTLKMGKLHVTHDLGKSGRTAAADARESYQSNAVIGHVHSISMSYRGNVNGSFHVGASFGWLGDYNAIDYMHQHAARREWQHGIGLGFMEDTGVVHLQAVPFIKGKAIVNGKLVTS